MKRRRFLLVGSWDMFHYAHLLMIMQARKLADKVGGELIVAVNTDALYKTYKKQKVIIPYKHRFEIIKSLRDVDNAVPTKVFSPLPVIKKYKITDYVLSKEWAATKEKEISYLKSVGGRVHILPRSRTISSTDIKKKIINLFGGKTHE